jgi:hypothetical protein
VGGDFTSAGKVRAVGVAKWDGAAWAEVGGTLADVQALAVYDGRLVAGSLGYCGEQIIKVWDGDSWENLGEGLTAWDDRDDYHPQCWDRPNQVYALQVYDGKLIAGGNFYRWKPEANPADHLAQWDGEAWGPVDDNFHGYPCAMTIYDGKLIVGGDFLQIGDVEARRIAAWDGSSWSCFGGGINPDISSGRPVWALAVYDGKLYAGGIFNRADTVAIDRFACWDGTSWSSVGFEAGDYIGDLVPAVFATAVYEGKLVVGGRFNKAKGALGDYIVAWNGVSWEELGAGLGGVVNSLMLYGDMLIAGGDFKFAGDQVVYNIAAWDGEAWHPMGTGQGLQQRMLTLAVLDDGLAVGGEFTIAGDTPANLVAEWDGSTWQPMDEGWSQTRAGALVSSGGDLFGKHGRVVKRWSGSAWEDYTADFGEDIRTISFYDGRLVAAGGRVAEWDGVSWTDLGSVPSGYVAAMLEADGDLIVGGRFNSIGGTEARDVARWNGTAWSAMGDGLRYDPEWEEEVFTLGLFEGDVIAGGYFDYTGNRLIKRVARWDGEAWEPLYKGVARDTGAHIYSLGVYNGTLVAAGDFRWAGDLPAWNIARWNGCSWSPMGSGIGVYEPSRDYIVNTLAVFGDCLYAGGDFPRAGGKTSFHIARWKDAFPGMVMYFEALVSGDDVHLVWTNPAAGAFRGTLIRYSSNSYPMEPDEGEPLPNGNQGCFEGAPGSDDSFYFTDSEGSTYYFTAFAYDEDLNYSTPAFAPMALVDMVPPAALSHFEAAPDTCGVRLAWTNPSDTDFRGTLIRYSNDAYPGDPEDGQPVPNGNNGVFEEAASAAAFFDHGNLACDTTYYYTAWAFDLSLNYSDPSYTKARSADPPEAPPVADFEISASQDGITLEWINPTGPGFESTTITFSDSHFPVHRFDGSPVPNGNDGVFAGSSASDSSFLHTGLSAGVTYYYGAWAGYEGGKVSTPLYRSETAFNPADTLPPDPPVGFAAVADTAGIRLEWRNPQNGDFTGALIRFSAAAYPNQPTEGMPVPNQNGGFFEGTREDSGSFIHAGLAHGQVFYYSAWSCDTAMNYSNPAFASYISVIDTVRDFTAIVGNRSISLYWAAPPCDSCEHYDAVVIRYSPDEFPSTLEDGEAVPNGDDGRFLISRNDDLYSFQHTGLQAGTTYKYSAFVVSDDPARASLGVHASASPTKIMPGIMQFDAVGEDRSVDLTWAAPEDPDIAGVLVRYSTSASPQELDDGVAVENGSDGVFPAEPGASGCFTHTGLMNGDPYYYAIWTFDTAGYYSAPGHAQATPLDGVPPDLWLAVFQNPYLSAYLDIYMLASEEVIADSVCVRVAADTVAMTLLDSEYNLWMGDYTLSAPAESIQITAFACDLAGNGGKAISDFAAGYVRSRQGGSVSSPDGKLRLRIFANTIEQDVFIVVIPCSGETGMYPLGGDFPAQSGTSAQAYRIGPAGLLGGRPATVEISYAHSDTERGVSPDRFYVNQDGVGPLTCYVDPDAQLISAEIHELGTFRLEVGERGASRFMDPAYLAVRSARPNPFSRETSVGFDLRATQHVRAVIYDIAGREMACLLDDIVGPGARIITWTGEGQTGKVPSGVYFLKISTDRKTATQKILLLR